MAPMFIECKQCGGQVPYEEGRQVLACPYCGSLNTIAKSVDTQSGLYNRANYLRRNSEFDTAMAVYEEILRLDNTDYEAHWGMALCKYGIEYVQDPVTGEKIPTCHRAQSESILNDISYRAAVEYAPVDARAVYQREAGQIDDIQKHIIALASREEKYDVFICYKEADETGNRTEDSVIAQELEFELKKRGYRVFFARKTLEGKLGSAYEPIIFAALQSAKVMVTLGTRPEHFQAVWVKNEWSRYIELIRKGAKKVLIPAYRGMSPYDLPQEFSNLQGLDMSRLGFMQDLCDGIDRLTKEPKGMASAPAYSHAAGSGAPGVEPILKRAYLFIEESNYTNANAYLERVLDANPEEARAYFGKLLIELGIQNETQLCGRIYFEFAKLLLDIFVALIQNEMPSTANIKIKRGAPPIDFVAQQYYNNVGWVIPAIQEAAGKVMWLSSYNNYNMAMRFAAPELKAKYQEYQNAINQKINEAVYIIKDTFERQRSLDTSFIPVRLPELWQLMEIEEVERVRRQKYYEEQKRQEELKKNEAENLATPSVQPNPQKLSTGGGCAVTFFTLLFIAGLLLLIFSIIK